MNFSKEIAAARLPIAKLISESVKINSVEAEPKEGMPFGEGPAKALEQVLEMGREMGFEIENFGNYVGHIDFGSGEEMLGILGHVDVVPAGDGWICDPFGGEIIDGKLYGRGTLDDKGPMIVCLYAMKILKDLGVPLRKKIRMILGTNEETNWGCMDYYLGEVKPKLPDLAFSPDATFPVTYAEKGILQYKLKKTISEALVIQGGNAFNSVAETAEVVLDGQYSDALHNAFDNYKNTGCQFQALPQGDGICFKVTGKAAHAARLENGINAISVMMAVLGDLKLTGELGALVDFYNQKIGMDTYGKNMGLELSDEDSGALTFNTGKLNVEHGQLVLCIDNRIPVTKDIEQAVAQVKSAIADTGFEVEFTSVTPSLYIAKDSPLVKTLMEVYHDITGDTDAQPMTAGGGTYSRTINNCVAFGCMLKGQENAKHFKNEYLELDKIDLWLELYLEAIYRLAK